MDLMQMLEPTLNSMGYELVDMEWFGRGKLRVMIDKADGINVDDCAVVSNHLTRLFAVEGVDYDRLEISSPGFDRPLTKAADFVRFRGERAEVKLKVPLNGRKNFTGVLGVLADGLLALEADGNMFSIELANVHKARLKPEF
jgi:ribosome maturation factor RimP